MTCDLVGYLSSQSAESWIAIWTGALFFATFALVFVAGLQVHFARVENRKTQTLLACGQYDTNPIVYDAHKQIITAKGGRARDDAALRTCALSLRIEILTVLNFLDSIAIGIVQGAYSDKLAKAHLSSIVRKHIAELIDSGVLDILECPRENFKDLITLDERWQKEIANARS